MACEARADDSAELPTRLREMFNALDTTTTCYEAFAALLHCMLPTDPLDWDATFATATNTDLTATLATLSASGSISYRYRSVLPTIDTSFNAKEEPVDGRPHAHHEEQERDQVDETGRSRLEKKSNRRTVKRLLAPPLEMQWLRWSQRCRPPRLQWISASQLVFARRWCTSNPSYCPIDWLARTSETCDYSPTETYDVSLFVI